MKFILYVLCSTISYALGAYQIVLLIRAIVSWLPVDEENRFVNFIYSITEPALEPIRALLDKFEFSRSLPLDLSFLVLYIFVTIVRMFLPTL